MNPIKFFSRLSIFLMKPDPMGGQALIEGVMMRSKERVSVALRRKNGQIETRVDAHIAFRDRYPIFKLPVLRGGVTLIEALVLGFRYLSWSADIAMLDEKGGDKIVEKSTKEKVLGTLSMSVALLIGIGFFMLAPIWLSGLIQKDQNPLSFNLIAGAIRIVFFVTYVWLISFMKDIQRVFEYHGAEHKSIFAYEAGEDLVPSKTRKYSTRHPRCGTSFLLIAGLACILVFAVIDAVYIHAFGPYQTALHRLLIHLLLIPLVSGISFEVLRLSDKFRSKPIVGQLILPGLWLQKITTREPDDAQLEVALTSLKNAL